MTRRAADSGELVRLVGLAVVVAGLVVGGAVGGRPALYATGLWSDGGSPTISPTLFAPTAGASTGAMAERAASGAGVISSAAPAPTPAKGAGVDAKSLAARISKVPTTGLATTSGVVLDATTGGSLYGKDATRMLIPASTQKLVTCAAALDVLGPDTTFTTRVVQPAAGKVVLVGGGDPYLTSTPAKTYPVGASSDELAARTAKALLASGQKTVSLAWDESLFTGPAWHPSWPQGYHDQVTTVSALWIDKGRATPTGAPTPTPAATAAQVFAAQLKAHGVTVTGTPAAGKASGAELARVSSLPLRTIVQEVLVHSDNSAAEVLLRHVGVAGKAGGSFTGGASVAKQRLVALGVPAAGLGQVDGSGLSRDNRLSAAALTAVLRAAVEEPAVRPLLEDLPTAGVTGTLSARFYLPAAAPGRGWVHAKTGTLTKVSTLAGTTRTASGTDVVFAFMANDQPDEWGARNWLDQVASAVAAS